jgi:hypothetical protein
MKDVNVLGAQAGIGKSDAAPKLAPGLHECRVIAVDRANGKDFTAGIMAQLAVTGPIIIEYVWTLPDMVELRPYSYADIINMPYALPRKGDRHYKRKPQPNCGPVGRNQW